MILDEIVENKRKEVAGKIQAQPLEGFKSQLEKSDRDFKEAITRRGSGINIIAEIKKASPSEGILRENFDAREIAGIYEKYAQAISVVTDEKFFRGNLEFIRQATATGTKPALGKEFIIDAYQIYELRKYGADAILLIASLLSKGQIDEFIGIASSLGMACLVEVHNVAELKKALSTKAEIIGINNRNLKTFEVDLNTTLNLVGSIPDDMVVVSESGIKTADDIKMLKGKADAILIGTAFMKEKDIEAKIREFAE